jgi:hypothetical protein
MEATNERQAEIKEYIKNWYHSPEAPQFIYDLGAFLLDFIDDLYESNLSESTIRKHCSNVEIIGWFECGYGYHDIFSPEIFKYPPFFTLEFERKVSDSIYAIQSYEATCNKLSKYAAKRLSESK